MVTKNLPKKIFPSTKGKSRISVRKFAGHAMHAEQLDHLRIAHLTDLHVGRVTPMKVQYEAVELTNQKKPDLVVLTGDFVCHGQKYLDELTNVISKFEAPVFCVLGNHDYWSGAKEVRWALKRGGAEVLSNQNTLIELRGQKLQLVGLDDAYTGHADFQQAVKGLRPNVATLGLSHIGEEAEPLWAKGVPLVLSGHTHAGQITVAKLHELAVGKIAGHKYVHGLYGSRQTLMQKPDPAKEPGAVYVGAGVGAAVMPVRLGERAKREMTMFELGRAPGTFEEHHEEQPPLQGRAPSPKTQARRAQAVAKKAKKQKTREQKKPSS